MTYAEKIVADLWRANTGTHDERVAIISAALKRQREACQKEVDRQLAGIIATHPWMKFPDVMGAEVEE